MCLVVVAKVATLLEVGRERLPELSKRLARIEAFAGTDREAWAVRQAYALIPGANFSRSILDVCPSALAVSRLPPVLWSDLGTPRRVFELLRDLGLRPSWLAGTAGGRVTRSAAERDKSQRPRGSAGAAAREDQIAALGEDRQLVHSEVVNVIRDGGSSPASSVPQATGGAAPRGALAPQARSAVSVPNAWKTDSLETGTVLARTRSGSTQSSEEEKT
jgi:hypothetical protein